MTFLRPFNIDLLTTLTVNKPSWTPTLLGQLKKRFSTIITNHDNSRLLDSTPKDKLLLPYMKPLPKVHEFDKPVSYDNLTKLTGIPIITANRWMTSNPSRLLGTELASIILQLKNVFEERNIPYHLIYNSYDLLLLLDKLPVRITNMHDLCLTTFDSTSFYTNISYHDTTQAIITSCKPLN